MKGVLNISEKRKVQLSVTVDEDVKKRIVIKAQNERRSLSFFVNDILDEFTTEKEESEEIK